jgi:cytoskeleton protein RodZ
MSEPAPDAGRGGTGGDSAGALLRAARERQGLHLAALAAAIKVSPRKLEALEADRWQDLPDATFVRALAQSVCRALKIDAHPVLQRLPAPAAVALDHVTGTLNAPFRGRASRDEPGLASMAIRPMVIASAVLMLAAVALLVLPLPWGGEAGPAPVAATPTAEPAVPTPSATPSTPAAPAAATDGLPAAPAPGPVAAGALPEAAAAATTGTGASAATAATAGAAPAAAPPVVAAPVAAAPLSTPPSPAVLAAPAASPAAAPAPPPPAGALQVRTREPSWVEVRDAQDRVLLSRIVSPGEPVGVDGPSPLRVTVGNAGGTELSWRGAPVDVAAQARDNVARLTLR